MLDRDHIGIVQVFESTLRVKKIPLGLGQTVKARAGEVVPGGQGVGVVC